MPVREISKYLSHSDLMPLTIAVNVKWNCKYAAMFPASALNTVHKNQSYEYVR